MMLKLLKRLSASRPELADFMPAASTTVAPDSATPATSIPDPAVSNKPVDFIPPPRGVSLERSFCQDGFVLLPQVFTVGEIADFRRAAMQFFPSNRPPFEPQFSNTAMFHPSFRAIFQNGRFIGALRTLFGDDFVFLNEFALHDSFIRAGIPTRLRLKERRATSFTGHRGSWLRTPRSIFRIIATMAAGSTSCQAPTCAMTREQLRFDARDDFRQVTDGPKTSVIHIERRLRFDNKPGIPSSSTSEPVTVRLSLQGPRPTTKNASWRSS
jgi:hypothetical protein